VPLSHPIALRLTPAQLAWLDRWRGETVSRGCAIRILMDEAIRLSDAGLVKRRPGHRA
jgi:hypothetical protein